MSQFTTQSDASGSTTGNGDARSSGSALMVRESEQHALSPYMGMTPGGMYFDGTPAGLSISELGDSVLSTTEPVRFDHDPTTRFDELFHRLYSDLFGLVYRLLGDRGRADLRASGRVGVFGDAR